MNTSNGRLHGRMYKEVLTMNIKKTLKQKFCLKYLTLVFLLLLYVPIIGLIVTQFAYKDYFTHVFIAFIAMFVIAMLLILVYEKRYALPPISNIRTLASYLEYFSTSTISDLEYTETITWFSQILHSAYIQKTDSQDAFTKTINKLHLILRPQDNDKLCIAFKHKQSFIKLSQDLCNSFDDMQSLDANIYAIQNEEPEKYKYIKFTLDKNILFYLLVFPIHIFGCLLLAKSENSTFNLTVFIANLALYIPADLLAILIYTGFIKNTKNP